MIRLHHESPSSSRNFFCSVKKNSIPLKAIRGSILAHATDGGEIVPSIIGSININDNQGTASFGDTFFISPKSLSKSISGQGGFNTGNVVITINGANVNNVTDPDVVDSSNAATL